MRKAPKFFGIHAEPSWKLHIIFGLLPFLVLLLVYSAYSYNRLKKNPADKLAPSIITIVETAKRLAFSEDELTGEKYILFKDMAISSGRALAGIGLIAIVALCWGMSMGLLPGTSALFFPFCVFLSIIPPVAILPILLIILKSGEMMKIALVFIGGLNIIIRIYHATKEIPREQIVKALTLGASQMQVARKIVLPQVMPKLLLFIQDYIGIALILVIFAESIAASSGVGYRIYLVRRYLAMDVMVTYAFAIYFIGFILAHLLDFIIKRRYPWYFKSVEN